MNRHDLALTLPWMRSGTQLVLAGVDKLSDEELREPSALAGWTRAHLVAHLARNAEALGRLAHWASTGEEIDRTAKNSAAQLRAELHDTAAAFDGQLSQLDDAAWDSVVRSAQGRAIPGRELPWMRTREVWLHGVDLGMGLTTAGFPADLVDVFLDDVKKVVGGKPACPPVLLRATDSDRTWTLGPEGDRTEVAAPAPELLAWVSGRPAAGLDPAEAPVLPPWI